MKNKLIVEFSGTFWLVFGGWGSAALAVAGALFLILESDSPFSGLARISSEPILKALSLLAP